MMLPRVPEVAPHALKVRVAHVFHAKDVDIRILLRAGADLAEELVLALAGLFGYSGHVDHYWALGLGHIGRRGL